MGTSSPTNNFFVESKMDGCVVSLKMVLVNTSLILMLVEMIQSSINSPQTIASFLLNFKVKTTHTTIQYMFVRTTIHHYRLSSNLEIILNKDLGDWMEACSGTWFSEFKLTKSDSARWIQHFRISKDPISQICQELQPTIQREGYELYESIACGD